MADRAVSVVIPCYNHARFINQAIESVASQTYPVLELVIVDDGSSDGSADLITEAAVKYKSRFTDIILQINEKNEGAHNAINRGTAAAHSNYISLLNSDDMYQPNRISSLMSALAASNGDSQIAFSSVVCIDRDGKRSESPEAKRFENVQDRLNDAPFTALACLAENVAISTGNLLFTKSLFKKAGGFKSYKYVHDYDFFLRCCLITEPVYDRNTQYLYRLHGDNTFSKIHKTGVTENRILWLDIYNQIKIGGILNSSILAYDNYMNMFEEQIDKEGKKKQTLWKLADKSFVKRGLKIFKKLNGINK